VKAPNISILFKTWRLEILLHSTCWNGWSPV